NGIFYLKIPPHARAAILVSTLFGIALCSSCLICILLPLEVNSNFGATAVTTAYLRYRLSILGYSKNGNCVPDEHFLIKNAAAIVINQVSQYSCEYLITY